MFSTKRASFCAPWERAAKRRFSRLERVAEIHYSRERAAACGRRYDPDGGCAQMIIECPMCRTRFRLDEAKIKGRGARVRCRRCGESIVVLKPEEPPAPPHPGRGAGLLDLRTVVQESLGEDGPAPPEREAETAATVTRAAGRADEEAGQGAAFERFRPPRESEPAPESAEPTRSALRDLSVDFRPEERIDLGLPAEPRKEPASTDFLIAGTETLDFLKEEYKTGPEPQAPTSLPGFPEPPQPHFPDAGPGESASAVPPEIRFPTMEPEPAPAEPRTVPAPPRPKPYEPRKTASPLLRSSLVALILLFLALAGAGAYLGFTQSGQELLRKLIPGMESLWLRGAGRSGPQFDVRNLIGYYETRTAAGNLFIIKGQVANMGRTRKSGIRVHATLLDGRDRTVAERTIYAGNVLAGETLRTASRAKIEEALANRFGDKLVNMDIAPGKSIPFMVVFFDAQEGISAYRLEAKDGE